MMYDAHIHLERYSQQERQKIFRNLQVDGMIAVSMDLDSCRHTLRLSRQYPGLVFPAFGFHPEQPLTEHTEPLFEFIYRHQQEMVAVGEIGLPYYLRQEQARSQKPFDLDPYFHLLEQFILLAKELDKPVVLHAVYEDAALVCDLLEKHGWQRAHFHWYKGDRQTTDRMIRQGYFISVTPDVLYKEASQTLVAHYPLRHMMTETDGPWPFQGPFSGQMTHPAVVIEVIGKIAEIKQLPVQEVETCIGANTRQFYNIPNL